VVEWIKQNINKGISYHYRNTRILACSSGTNGGLNVTIDIDNQASYKRAFHDRRGSIVHNIYINKIGDNLKIIDFLGAPKSLGLGRISVNAMITLLKAIYPANTVIYGILFSDERSDFDHSRRVKFWESCGFNVEDPTNYSSKISTTVGKLVLKDSYNGDRSTSVGLPYVIPLSDYKLASDETREKDDQDLQSFPMESIQTAIDAMPDTIEVESINKKNITCKTNILFSLMIFFSCLSFLLAIKAFSDFDVIVAFVFTGAISGVIAFYYLNKLINFQNKAEEKRSRLLSEARLNLKNWVNSNPTGIAYLNSLAAKTTYKPFHVYSINSCSALDLKHLCDLLKKLIIIK
jgi:hypothetical protein